MCALIVCTDLQETSCSLRRTYRGPGSSVGIATELRAGRSGIEFRWRRDFPPVQTGPGAHPAYCKMGTGSFLGVKCGRGVLLTTHPLLAPRSWKSRAIPLPTFWATPGLERDHFNFSFKNNLPRYYQCTYSWSSCKVPVTLLNELDFSFRKIIKHQIS